MVIDPKSGNKEEAITAALAQIEKTFGEGSVMRLGNAPARKVEVIPTGSLALDLALGIGGLPKGRIVEIYGPESSGKTTVALHIAASAQKEGGVAAFIDVEHALEPAYARALGVDIDSLLISQPDTGEQALEIAEALVRSGAIDVIVLDSVAAIVPKAEIEGEIVGCGYIEMNPATEEITAYECIASGDLTIAKDGENYVVKGLLTTLSGKTLNVDYTGALEYDDYSDQGGIAPLSLKKTLNVGNILKK